MIALLLPALRSKYYSPEKLDKNGTVAAVRD